NSPATMTLTCTETNASGDSSASGLFSAAVFPNPLAPAITVVKPGSTTAITAVSDGPGFVYVASLLPRPRLTYQWIAAPGLTGPTSDANGETFTFSFQAGVGTPAGSLRALQAMEVNAIGDFATGSRQLTVFTAPSSTLAITATSATDSGTNQFLATAGKTYTASIVSRGGAMTYQWTGANVAIPGPGSGAGRGFTAGSANADNSPQGATLSVRETNGAGDFAQSSRAGLVFPAPQAPVYSVARAPSGPAVTNQKITQTLEYMASVGTHAAMHYAWHIVAGKFTGGGTDSAGTPIESGAKNQVNFRGDDAFPSLTPTNVSLQVSEVNAIGDLATSAQ